MVLQAHEGTYPAKGFRFWRNDTGQIALINKEDFPMEEILNWLGIGGQQCKMTLGNCEGAEARERLAVMKFLYENPEFMSLAGAITLHCGVPGKEETFRNFYDPLRNRNPFWENYQKLVDFLAAKGVENLPDRIKIFYDSLVSFRELEADEREMARIVGEMLEANTVMEGVVTILFSKGCGFSNSGGNKGTSQLFYGHKAFSYGLSEARHKSLPKWLEKKSGWPYWLFSWNLGMIIRGYVASYNESKEERAFHSMVITECPDVIKQDIVSALHMILTKRPDEKLFKKDESRWNCLLAELPHRELEAVVHFAYGRRWWHNHQRDGLTIKILDIRQTENDTSGTLPESFFEKFSGYSEERIKTIAAGQKRLAGVYQNTLSSLAAASLRHGISEKSMKLGFLDKYSGTADIFRAYHDVPSPATDSAYQWNSLENIYRLSEIFPAYRAVTSFYYFVLRSLNELGEMRDVLQKFVLKAQELGTTICFPEILNDDNNIVEFSELYPLHLNLADKGDARLPVPISGLPCLNGRMIGLTGRHGGGKTVAEHTIAANVYLALSGLPVFGQGLRLNPKTHLGFVFVEGVHGQSVAQVLLDKIEKLFVGIKDVPQSHVLVVVDELGSNTQAESGLVFGKRVLKTLAQKKDVSAIFSTQILELAQFAENDLGAKCFHVTKEHALRPGISGGEFSELVRATQLEGLLVE